MYARQRFRERPACAPGGLYTVTNRHDPRRKGLYEEVSPRIQGFHQSGQRDGPGRGRGHRRGVHRHRQLGRERPHHAVDLTGHNDVIGVIQHSFHIPV